MTVLGFQGLYVIALDGLGRAMCSAAS